MKKLLSIIVLGLLFCGYANAKEKIYCLDLDNFGFKYIYVESTVERQYNLTAYEVIDKNNTKKCKGNVPSSINNHKFLKVDKSIGNFTGPYKSISITDLKKYFKKNNININLEKIVRDGKKDIASAEEFKPNEKSKDERVKELKVKLCSDDIEFKWNTHSNPGNATFEFKSSCDRATYITDLVIYTKDGREMKRYHPTDGYIRPFGVKTLKMYIGDLNKDLIETASYRNKMEKPKGSKKTNKQSNGFDLSNLFSFDIPGFLKLFGIGLIIYWIFIFITKTDDRRIKKLAKEDRKSSSSQKGNIIELVWNGEETMSKTFWIYCIVMGVLVGGVTGVLAGLYSNGFYILTGIYIFWSNIGLWNSSNKYRQAKLSLKQPYGWSTAAKVYVVFNFLTTLSQVGFILQGY